MFYRCLASFFLNKPTRLIAVIMALSLLGSATRAASGAPTYHVTYLGFESVSSLNNAGVIVGNDGAGGFIDDAGHITKLGTLGAPSMYTYPAAINDAGQVAGGSLTANFVNHGFLYSNGSLADLGTLQGYPKSQALSINAAGDVVGAAISPDGTAFRAILYHNSMLTDLGPGVANAINASGTIIGTSARRAVSYTNGSVVDLGNFGDSPLTSAIDVNNSGLIVGTSYVRVGPNSFVNHPFLYESGVWHDLGLPAGVPLGIPSAINNVGQVVGNSNGSLGSSDRPPFLYTGGTIYNLQSLLDSSGAGLSLELAFDINDSGAILAEGMRDKDSSYQTVLLTPVAVPEPASILMGLIGAAALGAVVIRKRRARG
jgi:probable HAF family extracellular repeat protein